MFGLPIEGEHEAYWGARAIYRGYPDYVMELLWDRQSAEGVQDQPEFGKWLDDTGLPWLRKRLKEAGLGSDSRDVLSFAEGNYRIQASPNGSYGYLYIGAVKVKETKPCLAKPH